MRFIVLILCFLLPAVSVTAQSDSPVAQSQFTFAYRLLQRGEHKLATQAFDDFLGRFVEDQRYPDACYYRGLLAQMQGESKLAAWYLAKAERTSLVPDFRVHLLRGKVASELGNPDEALEHLAKIDENRLDAATKANLWLTRAACYQQLNRTGPAIDALRNAADLDSPLKARALLDLARLQEADGQFRDAIASLERCLTVEASPLQDEAARLSGDLHYQLREYDKAIADYDRVLRRHADSPLFVGTVVAAMWAQFQAGQYDATIKTHERYRDTLPAELSVEALYLAGSAYQDKGGDADAAARFSVLLTTTPGSKLEDRVLYKLAVSQYRQKQYPAMTQTLDRLRAAHPESPFVHDGDLLLAKADLQQERIESAAAKLEAIIRVGERHGRYADALRQRAWLYESRGEVEQAVADYQRYLDEGLGAQPSDAGEVTLRLIDLYSRAGQHDKAAEMARELIRRQSQVASSGPAVQAEALYRLAHAQRAMGRLEEAHEALTNLLRDFPLSTYRTDAMYFDGLVLMALNRPADAMPLLRGSVDSGGLDPARLANALRLCAVYLRQNGKPDEAVELLHMLDTLSEGKGLLPEERLFLARGMYDQGRYEQAVEMVLPLTSRGMEIPGRARAEALLLIGYCRRDTGAIEEAVRLFNQVIALGDGFDAEAWLAKANVLLSQQQYEEAIEEYGGLSNVQNTPIAAEAMLNYARASMGLALRRTRAGDAPNALTAKEDARQMLLKLILLHNNPRLSPLPEQAHLELAELELELGMTDKAEKTYNDLIKAYPDSPYAGFARAMLDRRADRGEDVLLMLMRLDSQPLDPWLAERVHAQLQSVEAGP